ncbi:MAG: M48 family metallopeptidase, partial [Limisphaerales bacterium]
MVSAAALIIALLGAKLLAQLWLERLNAREVRKNSAQIPAAFVGAMDTAIYAKAVDYTLAKGRFGRKQLVFDALVLGTVLLSGLLPALYYAFNAQFGTGFLAEAAFLFVVGVILSIPS